MIVLDTHVWHWWTNQIAFPDYQELKGRLMTAAFSKETNAP